MTYINQMPMYEPFLNMDTDNLLNIFKTVKRSSDNKKKFWAFYMRQITMYALQNIQLILWMDWYISDCI